MRPLLRLAKILFALMVIGFVGIMLYNSIVAYTAEEILLDPQTRLIAEQAKAEHLCQIPDLLSFITIRLIVTSVEKCREDRYLVLFDDYTWFGRIEGFARYTDGKGVTGGGTVSDEEELKKVIYHFHTRCRQQ